jgi:acyl dehydratase
MVDSAGERQIVRGNTYEDFDIGRVFDHHWGRTLLREEGHLFATSLLQLNPLYFNDEYARQCGYATSPICPMLVFCTVFGLSVEDLSERGGAFLGVDELTFGVDVLPGDTLTARSTVLERRLSATRPSIGIVTWLTQGLNQDGKQVIAFKRTNMVIRASSQGASGAAVA